MAAPLAVYRALGECLGKLTLPIEHLTASDKMKLFHAASEGLGRRHDESLLGAAERQLFSDDPRICRAALEIAEGDADPWRAIQLAVRALTKEPRT